jgi:hypothetical protein
VGESTAATILLDQLLDWGFRGERFEQLDEIRAVSDLKQYFSDLVRAFHFLAMEFAKAEQLVRLNLGIE